MRIYIFFILFVIFGTLSHELVHFYTANYYGYRAKIHYASTSVYGKFKKFEVDTTNRKKENLYITANAPIFTFLIGLISFLLYLHFYKQLNKLTELFLYGGSLFLSRFVFNSLKFYVQKLLGKTIRGDEYEISEILKIDPYVVYTSVFVLSSAITLYATFLFSISNGLKKIFINAFGGVVTGYVLWFFLVGPLVLP